MGPDSYRALQACIIACILRKKNPRFLNININTIVQATNESLR
jgi:hypothetical protein